MSARAARLRPLMRVGPLAIALLLPACSHEVFFPDGDPRGGTGGAGGDTSSSASGDDGATTGTSDGGGTSSSSANGGSSVVTVGSTTSSGTTSSGTTGSGSSGSSTSGSGSSGSGSAQSSTVTTGTGVPPTGSSVTTGGGGDCKSCSDALFGEPGPLCPGSDALFDDLLGCVCNDHCAAPCGDACNGGPTPPECQDCMNNACFQQIDTCLEDF